MRPQSCVSRPRLRIARLWSDLPFISKVMLLHGLVDISAPNPMTAAPVFRVVDLQHRSRSKKKRGWAWLFIMLGCMKIRSAFSDDVTAARIAGTAYLWQALSISVEGFWHHSIPRPTKVLGTTIAFCVAMFAWLQLRAPRISLEGPPSATAPPPTEELMKSCGGAEGWRCLEVVAEEFLRVGGEQVKVAEDQVKDIETIDEDDFWGNLMKDSWTAVVPAEALHL
eukprot:g33520.t1